MGLEQVPALSAFYDITRKGGLEDSLQFQKSRNIEIMLVRQIKEESIYRPRFEFAYEADQSRD